MCESKAKILLEQRVVQAENWRSHEKVEWCRKSQRTIQEDSTLQSFLIYFGMRSVKCSNYRCPNWRLEKLAFKIMYSDWGALIESTCSKNVTINYTSPTAKLRLGGIVLVLEVLYELLGGPRSTLATTLLHIEFESSFSSIKATLIFASWKDLFVFFFFHYCFGSTCWQYWHLFPSNRPRALATRLSGPTPFPFSRLASLWF